MRFWAVRPLRLTPSIGLLTAVGLTAGALTTSGLAVLDAEAARAVRVVEVDVADGGWGDADSADVQAVIDSVVETMEIRTWATTDLTITVRHGTEPETAFRSDDAGPFVVTLAVEGTQWAQLAYQASHELCHVMSLNGRRQDTATDWFEESMCESVSLLALERIARRWRRQPPFPNWRSYATAFETYQRNVINRPSRKLPTGMTFDAWFSCQRPSLAGNPYDRDRNGVIAAMLLPLLRSDTNAMNSVSAMNRGAVTADRSFEEFVSAWSRSATPQQRRAIDAMTKPMRSRASCTKRP
jgi:hypothetical protein